MDNFQGLSWQHLGCLGRGVRGGRGVPEPKVRDLKPLLSLRVFQAP